jgi:hypothetical protein
MHAPGRTTLQLRPIRAPPPQTAKSGGIPVREILPAGKASIDVCLAPDAQPLPNVKCLRVPQFVSAEVTERHLAAGQPSGRARAEHVDRRVRTAALPLREPSHRSGEVVALGAIQQS